ncbi:MAG: type II toxin-antitoxin system VapC family toxin [Thermoguttaceae bacterium]
MTIVSVFLDTNIVIYLVERTPDLGRVAAQYIQDLIAQGQRLVVSDLVRMECSVRPLRMNDAVTLSAYHGYFGSDDVDVAAITAAVCDRAALIRARHNFRPMDCLHLATAIENGCQRLLTHDVRLRSFPDIAVEVLA